MFISWADGSLYVDDLLKCYRSKYIHTVERKLQQCFDKINKWAKENGFRIFKTKCVHFCHKKNLHYDSNLKLEKTEIPVVDVYKFLGLIFEKKPTRLYSPLRIFEG